MLYVVSALLHGKPEGRNYKPLYFSTRGVVAGNRQALQAAGSPTLRAAPRTVQLARAARYHRPRGSNIQSLLGNCGEERTNGGADLGPP